MEISFRQALLFSGLISFSILASAISFEFFFDLAPCKVCIWQRWPHVIIIAIMILGLSILNKTWILLLISLSAIVTGIIGFYHTGIEQGWWSGPLGCSNQFESETDYFLQPAHGFNSTSRASATKTQNVFSFFFGISFVKEC